MTSDAFHIAVSGLDEMEVCHHVEKKVRKKVVNYWSGTSHCHLTRLILLEQGCPRRQLASTPDAFMWLLPWYPKYLKYLLFCF